jgi:hypothetical protein
MRQRNYGTDVQRRRRGFLRGLEVLEERLTLASDFADILPTPSSIDPSASLSEGVSAVTAEADAGATISVTVAGQTKAAVNNGDGGWSLADQQLTALAEGVYDVPVTAADSAGNVGTDETSDELAIHIAALADVTVVEDAANTVIPLAGVFGNGDPNQALTYTVSYVPSNDHVLSRVDQVFYEHLHSDLLYTHQGDNRGISGAEHDLARDNLVAFFQDLRLDTHLDAFQYRDATYYNVVAEKPGITSPDDIYVVGAHYDSVNNPGADDNASGTAAVMEIARVLAPFDFDATIRFVAFDREEQGLYGSTAYATEHISDNILAMVNLDMIAFNPSGSNHNKVQILDGDNHDEQLKQDLIDAFNVYDYGDGITAVDGGWTARSDHAPFDVRGFDAALIIEHEWGRNPHYHRSTDAVETVGLIDYAYTTGITSAVTGYLASSAGLAPTTNLLNAVVDGTDLVLDYAEDQNGAIDLVVRATDEQGAWVEDSFTVTILPANDAPTVRRPVEDMFLEQNPGEIRVDLTSVFADLDAVTNGDVLAYSVTENSNSSLIDAALHGDDLVLSITPEEIGGAEISVQARDRSGRWVEERFIVGAGLLVVTSLEPNASGFTAEFSLPFDPSAVNLYGTEMRSSGPSDVTINGDSGGTIPGSLVLSERSLTFVATGGALPPDDYRVRFRSAADGFHGAVSGTELDGDLDLTPGGEFESRFTRLAPNIEIRLPDFTRGPGQPVNVPGSHLGLPLWLSDGTNITSVELTVHYDPALLTITNAALGADVASDATFFADTSAAGQVQLRYSATTPLPPGNVELAKLTAHVPATAPTGSTQILKLEHVRTNGGAVEVTSDDALHVVGYFGDASGNGDYSGLDAGQIARVVVGNDTGFETYPLTDPVLIADITRNGDLSGLDAVLVAREVVGLDPPEIPPLPYELAAPSVRGMPGEEPLSVAHVGGSVRAAGSANTENVLSQAVSLPSVLLSDIAFAEISKGVSHPQDADRLRCKTDLARTARHLIAFKKSIPEPSVDVHVIHHVFDSDESLDWLHEDSLFADRLLDELPSCPPEDVSSNLKNPVIRVF